MNVTIFANSSNTKNILTLIEEQGYTIPCNCHGQHHCRGSQYSFDCSLVPQNNITVSLPQGNNGIVGVAIENITPTSGTADTILIDIGTTTIALALVERATSRLRQTLVFSNPQRSYGSDVISRIQAAMQGEQSSLQQVLIHSIEKNAAALCERNQQTTEQLTHCIIGGNTTMIHLLMRYDCENLSHSPFTITIPSPNDFRYNDCCITILPWLSAFVGGDITAGLYACHLENADHEALFIDLGTNGEMVLSHNGTLFCTSVAAGPAFEGGNLSCGCAAIPGSIQNVQLKPLRPLVTTIDNKLPIGICGSGAIHLCAELIRKQYVTRDGILTEKFPAKGIHLANTTDGQSILFTPEDFRNMQLAIAAIAAGIDTLADIAGITPSQIPTLYLGGGFGFYLSLADIMILGIFSNIPLINIQPMGNTCLHGLLEYSTKNLENKKREAKNITANVETIQLADNSIFQSHFLHHMTYPAGVISTT